MWAWDADSMQIMAVNEATVEKYGYDRERFLSLRITDLLDPSELERFGRLRLPFSENRQSAGVWLHRTAAGRQIDDGSRDLVVASARPRQLAFGRHRHHRATRGRTRAGPQ